MAAIHSKIWMTCMLRLVFVHLSSFFNTMKNMTTISKHIEMVTINVKAISKGLTFNFDGLLILSLNVGVVDISVCCCCGVMPSNEVKVSLPCVNWSFPNISLFIILF